MNNFKSILVGILGIVIGIGTMTGHVQEVIKFADPLNEMFFCVMSFLIGVMGFMSINFKLVKNEG
jgi:hypothetical protein